MKREIDLKRLLLLVFVPAAAISLCYLFVGRVCTAIPNLLLFCILGTFILLPFELGVILYASKKENGKASLKTAFVGQEKMAFWKTFLWAFLFFGVAGLMSTLVAPLEAKLFEGVRGSVLSMLPTGFDWTNFEYVKTFSKPVLILTCVYYGVFNAFVAPVTEELFFRGYLTSHFKKQGWIAPVLVSVLFSLYHFWLPFNNIFRILTFLPVYYAAYKKKNIYIGIGFHCMCNTLSVVNFALAVLK